MRTDLAQLAEHLVDAAAKALAAQGGQPPTVRVLREYREDARAVTVAVLRALSPKRRGRGQVGPVLTLPGVDITQVDDLAVAVEQVPVP